MFQMYCAKLLVLGKNCYCIVRQYNERLRWFGHVQTVEGNRIPTGVLYMNLGTTRLRGRPWNRWQDEVREDGRIVDGEGWQEKVHKREEWNKFLRTARNHQILHMPKEWINNQKWTINITKVYITTLSLCNIYIDISILSILNKFSHLKPSGFFTYHRA